MDRTHPPRLDPRQPLVVDTHELGRRPGSMRELSRAVPAPAGLGMVDLIGVPVGSAVELDLRLESVMDGVLVTAQATAPVVGECGRCLDPINDTLTVRFQELYAYPDTETDADEEDELRHMQGDLLDLESALRDAVVLALPVNPLCDEDCEGLCATCGERLADLPEDHQHAPTDARWSALADLLQAPPSSTPDNTVVNTPEEH